MLLLSIGGDGVGSEVLLSFDTWAVGGICTWLELPSWTTELCKELTDRSDTSVEDFERLF